MNFLVVGIMNVIALTANPVEIKVDVCNFPPLVIENNDGTYSGFEIDLWNAICQDLEFKPVYNSVKFENIFDNLKENKCDIAIAGLSITSDREEVLDFSHPTLNSGFLIAVLSTDGLFINRFINIWYEPDFRSVVWRFFLFIFLASLALYSIERNYGVFDKNPLFGYFQSMWCIFCTITTIGYGDYCAKSFFGRTISVCVMFIGIAFFSFMVSISASSFSKINESNLHDRYQLAGQNIVTLANTSSIAEIRKINANPIPAKNEIEMIELLKTGSAKAILFDSPWIINYMRNNEGLALIGDVFSKHHYGFAFSHENYKLRSKINKSLLKLRENGTYDVIYERWFSAGN